MVSPGWDAVFILNAPWVLFAAAHILYRAGWFPDGDDFRHFYITLPHRFITLALVFLDREQFSRRPKTFIGLPIAFALLVVAAGYLGSGRLFSIDTFVCILTIDYIWNAYHFASQHYGVTRIYGRKAGSGRPALEKAILVPAITWALLTAANWTLVNGPLRVLFTVVDGAALLGLVTLLILELRSTKRSLPKLGYLASVTLLYGGFLLLPYLGFREARLGLLAAASYFHAVEYLGIVHFYVKGKQQSGSFRSGVFRLVAPVWAQTVVVFALTVGTLMLMSRNVFSETGYAGVYLGMLTVASFCHYAFDGMIWKLRKPRVSKALGVEAPS